MALTTQQERFVSAYIQCRNATVAAREAGYSESTAVGKAYEILRHPEVKETIKQRFASRAMDADEYLANLAEVARGEWGAYIDCDESGRVLRIDLRQLKADGYGHLIQSAEQTRSGIKVRFPSRIEALKLIGQGLGLLGNPASESDLAAFIERFSPKEG